MTLRAYTLLRSKSRDAFRGALQPDKATWARGRGWALWKALITLAGYPRSDPEKAGEARHVIAAIFADHEGDA